MTSNSPKKILVVGPAWVGDMVMTQSLFKVLKQQDPAVTIEVLAPAWSMGLLERMPEVARSLASPFGHGEFQLRRRIQLGRQLRAARYDQVIFIPNSFKSALAPLWARIPQRTGWHGEWPRRLLLNDARRLDKKRLPLMVQRFAALGLPADMPLPDTIPWPQLTITTQSPQPQQPVLAIAPGAEFGPSKRWPAPYFAEIANAKLREGWAVWLFGSPRDQAISDQVNALTQRQCRDLTGQTTLAQAIDELALATIVLTNDSGLMHIAAALGRPVLAVYGSTPADITPPLTKNAESLHLNLPCRPCMQRECPLGHWRCMLDLKPAAVLAAMDRLGVPA